MAEEVFLTQEGLDMIKAEYDERVSVTRQEIAEKLKEARSYGDLSENAEYDAAKEEQAENEDRINKLDQMLRNAHLVNGVKIKVKDLDTKESREFFIVGSPEADPFAEPPRISNESAVGRALWDKAKGDVVDIALPDSTLHYQVVRVFK